MKLSKIFKNQKDLNKERTQLKNYENKLAQIDQDMNELKIKKSS